MLLLLAGCYQGHPSKEPPIHINPNMDWQPKVEAQEEFDFFSDETGMRTPIEGTVARGELRLDDAYYLGKEHDTVNVRKNPLPITMELVRRGQDRYNIYCTPCHGRTGDGKGIIATKEGMVPPASFHDDRIRKEVDGYLFNVMSNGLRNMQAYRFQIPIRDRWAIVAYVRALQLSHDAPESVVPAAQRAKTN